MSIQDTNNMPSYAVYDNTAVGQSATTSHSDSTQNTISVDVETLGIVHDLWLAGQPGHAEIRPIPNKQYQSNAETRKACWRNRTSVEIGSINSKAEFIETVMSIAKDPEMAHSAICFGICPRTKPLQKQWDEKANKTIWIGGRSEDVVMYPGVVYDLDDHSAEDGESLSHGAEMLRELSQKTIDPTFKVKSGGGSGEHGYYRLREPVDVATGNRINRKLARLLRSDMKITDPSHVMRIPGTWNTKTGNVVPVTIFDVTGELHDPVALETAIDLVARENGIDISADYTQSQSKSAERNEWPPVSIEEARRITEVCARMAYYATQDGANTMSYWEWFGMATVLHSLTPDDSSFFDELSRLYDGHDDNQIREKWKNVRNTNPVSCAWFQAERPLEVCKTCRFYRTNREEGERI
ncbi:hypothetical protein JZ785_18400 [Alicyclobacillus curvatus]|nr:hypothetical protein JZ785_18400 [Alicyclobacillus curvatus]